jgi:hypothetical protein
MLRKPFEPEAEGTKGQEKLHKKRLTQEGGYGQVM